MKTISAFQKDIKNTGTKITDLSRKKDVSNAKLARLNRFILEKEKRTGNKLKSSDPLLKSRKSIDVELKSLKLQLEKLSADKNKLIGDLTLTIPIQDRLQKFSADYPVLLLPVRLQTRFMTVKHVVKGIKPKDIFDVKELPIKDRKAVKDTFENITIKQAKTPLSIPNRIDPLPSGPVKTNPRKNPPPLIPKEKPNKGFEKIPDKEELWIRIYPDDIFVHTHEDCLTKAEYTSAEFFWKEIHLADKSNNDLAKRKDIKIGAWRSLVGSYGTPRAAYIVKITKPAGTITKDGQPIVEEAPEMPSITIKESSWTKAPCTYMLPDQFVIRLYTKNGFREVFANPIPDTLILGLDPEGEDVSDFELNGQERIIPDNIKWLTEFEYAEKIGMGVRIDITPNEKKSGFTKIIVLGAKTSLDEKESQHQLEKLLDNHHYAAGGMSILKQGTPTNNTTKDDSGFHSSELDPKQSFDNELGSTLFPQTANKGSNCQKRDGEYLTSALGVSPSIFNHIENADHTDICDSIAMNRAMYPATIGYSLEQFHSTIVNKNNRKNVRSFFENFVLGRGKVPVLRIDRQPYGIIPTSSFSKWDYNSKNSFDRFLKGLHQNAIVPFKSFWNDAIDQVNYMTSPKINNNNFSSVFLDVLGLHASSIDYYQRFVAGPQASYNASNHSTLLAKTQTNINNWINKFSQPAGKLFEYTLLEQVKELYGPIVDNLTLSEERGVRPRKGSKKNYIDFLIECTIDQIRNEKFDLFSPDDPVAPHSLLYLLLRHALLRENLNVGYDLLIEANQASSISTIDFELDQLQIGDSLRPEHESYITDIALANHLPQLAKDAALAADKKFDNTIKFEKKQEFVTSFIANGISKVQSQVAFEVDRQKAAFHVEQDKFACFEKSFPALTGKLKLKDYLRKLKKEKSPRTINLRKMQSSLKTLNTMSTASLERCFAEHLDTCSYRLDAWQQGLVSQRLEKMRSSNDEGIYLGAFAILENLKPGGKSGVHVVQIKSPKLIDIKTNPGKTVNPVIDCSTFDSKNTLNTFLRNSFIYLGDDPKPQVEFDLEAKKFIPSPVVNKNISEGFIHAPTTSQAMTAAVLKGGYNAHQKSGSAHEILAVNLTSKRVRTAMYYLQGMRNGQEIAQLLGYQFERDLHDSTSNTLNHLLVEFRNEFPFRADVLHPVGSQSNTLAESYHVVDGLSLLKDFQDNGIAASKINTALKDATAADKNSVETILERLDEAMDAVNDLMVAESVFQIVVGSPEASSAAMKVMSESGEINQMPEVVKIPRTGLNVTHRVGIQIPISSSSVAWTSNKASARSKVSRNVNSWLKDQLPAPQKICVRVKVNDGPTVKEVNMKELGCEPIDFVQFLANQDQNPQNGYIPAKIKCYLRKHDNSIVQSDTLTILFDNGDFKSASKICLFEMMPLVRSLFSILSTSRAALPEDFMEQSKANTDHAPLGDFNNTHLRNCLADLIDGNGSDSLHQVISHIENAKQNLTPILDEDQQLTKSQFGTFLNLSEALLDAAIYNIPSGVPNLDQGFSFVTREVLINQTDHVLKLLEQFKTKTSIMFESIVDSGKTGRDEFDSLKQLAEALFGRACFIYPEITIDNHAEMNHARNNSELLKDADPFAVEDWLLGASVVRPRLKQYQVLQYLREVFNTADKTKTIELAQLPFVPGGNNRWLGLAILDKESIPLDPISLAFEYPKSHNVSGKQMALIFDEWNDNIPEGSVNTGVALHYNRPNNEASQNLLLVVPPTDTLKNWKWEDLVGAVDETLTLAKMRAVEPEHLKSNPLLFKLLPGIVAAMNAENKTPSLDLGRNNYIPYIFLPGLLDFQFTSIVQNG